MSNLLFTGGPETGNSYCIDIISQLCDIMIINLKILFMEVATINIYCSTVQICFHIGEISDTYYFI